jgi:hypothetical protein
MTERKTNQTANYHMEDRRHVSDLNTWFAFICMVEKNGASGDDHEQEYGNNSFKNKKEVQPSAGKQS